MLRAWPILAIFILSGCGGAKGPPIDFVVPKGFAGPIWIMLDSSAQDIPLVKGRYLVTIPSNGILRVRTFEPFHSWHQASARYDDGPPLPLTSGASPAGANTVALRGGGSAMGHRNGKEIHWMPYFVGTEEEYRARPAMDFPPEIGR